MSIYQRIVTLLDIGKYLTREYTCGDLSIRLPSDHLLPLYQREHRLYDRFLPYLCQSFSANEWIIDVGANCGDTLAAILSKNQSASCICIEADSTFFLLLKKNIEKLQEACPSSQLIAIPAFVGTGTLEGTLEGAHGTKGLRTPIKLANSAPPVSDNSIALPWVSLESVWRDLPETSRARPSVDNSNVIRLIKSDVDGFDHDVLTSAGTLLNEPGVMLFFECYFENQSQRQGFVDCFSRLISSGFRYFDIFDNFGNHMVRLTNLSEIESILGYIWRQGRELATRTVYYVDVLAYKTESTQIVRTAIDSYMDFVEKRNS